MTPPACQDSVSLTKVTSQDASLLSREVGKHCPRFINERLCTLFLRCVGGFFSFISAGVGDEKQSWDCRGERRGLASLSRSS